MSVQALQPRPLLPGSGCCFCISSDPAQLSSFGSSCGENCEKPRLVPQRCWAAFNLGPSPALSLVPCCSSPHLASLTGPTSLTMDLPPCRGRVSSRQTCLAMAGGWLTCVALPCTCSSHGQTERPCPTGKLRPSWHCLPLQTPRKIFLKTVLMSYVLTLPSDFWLEGGRLQLGTLYEFSGQWNLAVWPQET